MKGEIMFRKLLVLVFGLLLVVTTSGCFLLLAGAVGGGGTAAWLSGKLSQEVNVSFENGIKAANRAMDALDLDVNKLTTGNKVAQIKGEYLDGRKIWIDIHRVSKSSSRIEVRVGATGDMEASRKILDKILQYSG